MSATIDELRKEFFNFDVTFNNGSFGRSAKWSNNFHPENTKFMQSVNWVAYENGDRSKIIVRFSFDKQYNTMYDFAVIDNNRDFESIVFDVWNNQ